ncbi:exo-alpha-sialidase [Trypanosoma cruzi]|nr:exo-alpha-sialidase [Trypanosoma cruzi]
MLASCTVIVPRKAAVPPSLTLQQSAAVPHSPRIKSNITRDTHPCTAMSPISAMDNKSVRCPCSQKPLLTSDAASYSDGISGFPGAMLKKVGAAPAPPDTLPLVQHLLGL